jgi:uncharacterized membrane protein YhhN
MYGGLQLAIGALALAGLLRESFRRPALVALVFLAGGLFVARAAAAAFEGELSSYTLSGLGFELVTVALASWVPLCALCVGGLLASERAGWRTGVWIAKPAAALCFLWAALAWGALGSAYGRFVLLGLALSACGDVLLITPGRGRLFQVGILAFLLGHVAYAVAFASGTLDGRVLAFGAGVLGLAAWRTLRWLSPHVPSDLRVPVVAYVIVIGAMVALAFAAMAAGAPRFAAIGALAFAISDLSVARDRFVAPGFANAAWGLPLYFAAQLALASTVAGSAPTARHLLFPAEPVEAAHRQGRQVHALETAHVDGDVVRVGAGDAEGRDPAGATEVVLRRARTELVGLDRAPGREQPEALGRHGPVDVGGARADRAVADLEIRELAVHLVADRTAVTGAPMGRHVRPPAGNPSARATGLHSRRRRPA